MTLVDSNVILDVLTGDANWLAWSIEALNKRLMSGPLLFNEVVYAELSVKSSSEDVLDQSLTPFRLRMDRIPKPALFLAGKVFGQYRSAGGARANVLPDFFIGAHAHVASLPILTRDARRYRTYFPDVELITPP